MGYIQASRTQGQMVGAINGKQFGLAFSETRFARLLQLQEAAETARDMNELQGILDQAQLLVVPDFQEVLDHASPYLKINKEKGTYHLFINGVISPVPLPAILVAKIETGLSMGINITPVVKAWTRFLRNDKFSLDKAARFANYLSMEYTNTELMEKKISEGITPEIAKLQATTLETALTSEGLCVTYKVSTEVDTKFVKDGEDVKQVSRHDWEVDEFSGLKVYKKSNYAEDRVFRPAIMGDSGDAFDCVNILTGDKTTGHIIRVGHIHALGSWDKVDTNDRHSGCPGLHIGKVKSAA